MSGPGRLARFGYATLLRTLALIGGFVAGYGTTGMITSAGIMPPNALVIAGAALVGIAALALFRSERALTGLWPALLIPGALFFVYAIGSLGPDECPQPHPPIGSAYSCAPVGSHALAFIAPVVAALGILLLLREVAGLARSRRSSNLDRG